MKKTGADERGQGGCTVIEDGGGRSAGEFDTGLPERVQPPYTGTGILSPYIGVTGFMDVRQVMQTLSLVPLNSNRKVMVGVLASSTTLLGQVNKLPGRFPLTRNIGGIFVEHPLAFNVIHYATRDPATLSRQLVEVVALAPDLLQGIQLNMVWPDPAVIRAFKLRYPNVRLILQVGPRAFDAVGRRLHTLAMKLCGYRNAIDYVLLDDSGGYGKQMDPQFLLPFVRRVKSVNHDMQIVVAGGLSHQNLSLILPITIEFPDVSIDAEGNLRDDSHDCLDMKKVRAYVVSAFEFFLN